MRVVERHILGDRGYDVDPSFSDPVLDPLVRLRAKGTFEWVLGEVVNPDTADDARDQALAGLDALLRIPATGDQRRVAVNRILGIYQSYMFHVEDDFLEVAGYRGTKFKGMQGAGPYWESMRPTVMRALRELSTDPRTGLPPFDIDTKGEIGTLERHQVWFAQNGLPGRAPWVDGEPKPRRRADAPYTRMPPPAWFALGAPWAHAWRTNRTILDRPLEPAMWRDELRATTLPELAGKMLADPAWQVRAAAAVTLGRIAAPGASEALRARIERDPVEEVREAALLGLLLIADEEQRDFLRERATHPAENPRVRAYALLALARLRDADTPRAIVASGNAPPDVGACAIRALGLAGGTAPEIAAILADRRRSPHRRGEAGTALVCLEDRAVLQDVMPVFKERTRGAPVGPASAAIAARLVPPDDARTIKQLARGMGDTDEAFTGVRTLLAASLAGMGGVRGPEAVAAEYAELRPNSMRFVERGHFLIALGSAGADGARHILRKEIEALDHEWDLGACALAVALAGERGSLPTLRSLLRTKGESYAPHGMMALALLADAEDSVLIRETLARLRSDGVLEEGALALAILDGGKAVPDLLGLWERARRPEHYDAFAWAFRLAASADAIPPLRALAEGGPDPVQRAFALMGLGRMADPAAPLHALARGSNPYAGNPTLLDLARWRDAAPLLD
jgi:HEAT repeat protein